MKITFELTATEMVEAAKNGTLQAFLANASSHEKVFQEIKAEQQETKLEPLVPFTPEPKQAREMKLEPTNDPAPWEEQTQAQAPAPEPTQRKYNLVDVRALLGEKIKAGHRDTVAEIIKTFGGTSLTDLPEAAYDEVYEAAEKL